jgi:putative ABC transport system permease protein
MFANYLKIAFRNLLRHRFFSFINVVGLTLGMTCCFLIMLFVRSELSYDRFQEKFDRLYRVTYLPKFAGMPKGLHVIPPVAAPLMTSYFPEMEAVARLFNRSASLEATRPEGPVRFEEERFFFADPDVLKLFSFHFLEGNPAKALTNNFSVVLTDKAAKRFFGDGPALGKTLLMSGKYPLTVSGVIEELPANSHIHIDAMANYETMFSTMSKEGKENLHQNWIISHSSTYVLLKPGQDPARINARFPQFLQTHAWKEFAKDIEYTLQPLGDIHLRSDLMSEVEPVGNQNTVYIFIGIAAITLLIAGINFVNLATARSLRRAKEVGMRKVLGADRKQLIGQFLGESLLLSLLAFLFSILLTEALFPVFNELTQKDFSFRSSFGDLPLLAGMVGLFLLVGVLAGLYPAFFISGFKPVETLKGQFSSGKAKGGILRQSLLVFQFTASVALMIGTLVAYRQLAYIRNQELGFVKDHVVTVPFKSQDLNAIFDQPDDSLATRLQTFRNILLRNPAVREVTLANQRIGVGGTRRGVVPEGFTGKDKLFAMSMTVDYHFIPAMGLQVIAGRPFSEKYGTDLKEGFIVNETAVKRYKWGTPAEAIGRKFNLEGKHGKIIGVVKDFHAESLFLPIDVLVMDLNPRILNVFTMKISPENTAQTIDFIRREWNTNFPQKVFQYEFLDRDLSRAYDAEQRLSSIIGYFAGLAVFISCLGLFGLIALAAQQRTKEIGIRKVLGASISQIVVLLSKDFLRLVLLSILIAGPIAWYFMDKWLQAFAYRIDIAWWMYAAAGLAALTIAFATVGFHSVKAAVVNPSKSLKSE